MINGQSEQAILKEVSLGNPQAFKVLYETYLVYLLKEAYPIVLNKATCEDLVQDLFTDLWHKRKSIDVKEGALRSYLKTAITNRALNHIKSTKKITFTDLDLEDTNVKDDTTEALESKKELENKQDAIDRAIDTLPERRRIIFIMNRVEKKSHKEISAMLGITVKTIENQMTEALKNIRKAVIDYEQLSSIVILLILLCGLIGDFTHSFVL